MPLAHAVVQDAHELPPDEADLALGGRLLLVVDVVGLVVEDDDAGLIAEEVGDDVALGLWRAVEAELLGEGFLLGALELLPVEHGDERAVGRGGVGAQVVGFQDVAEQVEPAAPQRAVGHEQRQVVVGRLRDAVAGARVDLSAERVDEAAADFEAGGDDEEAGREGGVSFAVEVAEVLPDDEGGQHPRLAAAGGHLEAELLERRRRGLGLGELRQLELLRGEAIVEVADGADALDLVEVDRRLDRVPLALVEGRAFDVLAVEPVAEQLAGRLAGERVVTLVPPRGNGGLDLGGEGELVNLGCGRVASLRHRDRCTGKDAEHKCGRARGGTRLRRRRAWPALVPDGPWRHQRAHAAATAGPRPLAPLPRRPPRTPGPVP